MMDMVERVARAIAFDQGIDWEGLTDGDALGQDELKSIARTAIEAMKLPLPEPPSAEKQSIGQAALRMMVKP